MDFNLIYKGIVEDNNDPQKRNRLKVRVGQLHGSSALGIPTVSIPWAEAVSPILIDPPIPVGSIVYVTFEQGDKNYPIYLGYFIKRFPNSQCFQCAHLTGAKRCDAFPEEIPDEIYNNSVTHNIRYLNEEYLFKKRN